ncbi:MAG: FAD-binding oxidoreductase [Myxococcales bacterium]|nr:FAD-binding oxidoreductase [Myxococcales bacterium]
MSGPRTVIIGGGIVGLSLAWNLAKRGWRHITVLERDHLNAGASARCGGGVRAQWSTADNIRIMKRSEELFESFPQDTGFNNWFRQDGYLFLAYTDEQAAQFEKNDRLQHENGVRSQLLSPTEIKRLVPWINTAGIRLGSFHKRDGVCFPFAMVWGYTKVCRQLGVEVLAHHEVTALETAGTKIVQVVTPRGAFAADLVVNATSAWAPQIGRMCGVELPNHPEKHEAIVTEPLHSFLGTNLIPMNSGMYVAQTMRGEIYACVGLEKGPASDYNSTFAFMRKVSRLMIDLVPRLSAVKVLRQWAGFYDITPDTNPIIGYVDRPENFYQYHGLMGHGFMFAPALSEMVADHLVSGRVHPDLANYDLGRFERGGLEVEQMIIG